MDGEHEYLKVAEVLRVSLSPACELVVNGEFPAVKIGCSVRVSRRELDRWLEGQSYKDVARG